MLKKKGLLLLTDPFFIFDKINWSQTHPKLTQIAWQCLTSHNAIICSTTSFHKKNESPRLAISELGFVKHRMLGMATL
jgi:hypothetical protein